MTDEIMIKVPDIGGSTNVDVIEILVRPGDKLSKDTPLITLESDKASMEIPSPKAGIVGEIKIQLGDKVSEGDNILTLLVEETKPTSKPESSENESLEKPTKIQNQDESAKKQTSNETKKSVHREIRIPDIGGAKDVDVIEILVKEGQFVSKDQGLITLEGDKATMDIPSEASGTIQQIAVKIGDKVSQGDLILTLETEDTIQTEAPKTPISSPEQETVKQTTPPESSLSPDFSPKETLSEDSDLVYAGPAVRRMARELGVNMSQVKGTGRKGRVTKDDITLYIKSKLSEKPSSQGIAIPSAPIVDFSKFGKIDIKPLNKIKRLTGINVHRSWVTIPHVTQFDEADITDLEEFRKSETSQNKQMDYKLTILAFVTRVVAQALKVYPQFNASLDSTGENLVYKQYYNIGIAVETPNGLVVPVIQHVDQLQVSDIAKEMGRLSAKAREKGLMPTDMTGGCFTISSLGGIGGTSFTPIVNSPEVAILGLSRSAIKPIYQNGQFVPRLMLPLSLSYDHRVIDGAEAARFTRYLVESLSDIRRLLL